MTSQLYYQSGSPTYPAAIINQGSVTRLVGFIRDSGNRPITNGWIEITADDILTDGSVNNRTLIVPKPARFVLTSAPLDIPIINSQYSEATYRIRVGETLNNIDTVYCDFHAQIPYGSVIDITALIPQNIKREQLPSTVYRIAELITTDPVMRARMINIFNFMGNWATNTEYKPYDLVFVPGTPNRTLICTTLHVSGGTINNSFWQQLI